LPKGSSRFFVLHPKLGKEVPRLEKCGHPDQDEGEANPKGFDLAIAVETEQGVGDKNEPSDRGEENQCEEEIGATFGHKIEIKEWGGNQSGAYQSTGDGKTADSGCAVISLHSPLSTVFCCNRCNRRPTRTDADIHRLNYSPPAPLLCDRVR
jgi:hypothetical protein